MEVEQNEMVVTASGGPTGAVPEARSEWRGDVALELWVEADVVPVRIRLAGRLDASTATNLEAVVAELLDDGTRHIDLYTDGLCAVDPAVDSALADVERRVRLAGGTLLRVAPLDGPHRRSHLAPAPATEWR